MLALIGPWSSYSGPPPVGPAPPLSVADTFLNLGAVEEQLGNFQKALDLYEKALEIMGASQLAKTTAIKKHYRGLGLAVSLSQIQAHLYF